ncbi:MAG: aspartate carbamoyltransferase regulatory subunit [Bacteroidota bacterium]|nr:aspartate carbamoyltransferase regulatory subunit [Bacteroidota bacterium]
MSEKKKLHVSAIKNGTVIDHIPANQLFTVLRVLGLDHINKPITFGTNMESKKLGSKGLIKIWDIYLEEEDLKRIALITEDAVINVIENYQVREKKKISTPEKIEGLAKCVNPKCITNHEKMNTRFTVLNTEELALRCDYCEKITEKKNFKII